MFSSENAFVLATPLMTLYSPYASRILRFPPFVDNQHMKVTSLSRMTPFKGCGIKRKWLNTLPLGIIRTTVVETLVNCLSNFNRYKVLPDILRGSHNNR
jgi:hypothetical protein